MSVYSLQRIAETLGTTRRRLQYYLDKSGVVPDRRILLGRHSVRYYAEEDLPLIIRWWKSIDKGGALDVVDNQDARQSAGR